MIMKKWKQPKMKHLKWTKWKWLPLYPKNIHIGEHVDIGALTALFGQNGIIIRDNVDIGSHCSIYSENTENGTYGPVIIKKGAKIGAHCVIFPNVVIEIGEKIPAGSIVYVNKNNERVIKRK